MLDWQDLMPLPQKSLKPKILRKKPLNPNLKRTQEPPKAMNPFIHSVQTPLGHNKQLASPVASAQVTIVTAEELDKREIEYVSAERVQSLAVVQDKQLSMHASQVVPAS